MRLVVLLLLLILITSPTMEQETNMARTYTVNGYSIKAAPTVEVFSTDIDLYEVKVIKNKKKELQQVVVYYGEPEKVEPSSS